MNGVAADMTVTPAPADVVPAEIALSAPERVRPRRLLMLLGVPGLWLFPKTFGPHVAAGPLWLALLACALGSCGGCAIVIVAQAVDLPDDIAHPDLPLTDKCRIVIAQFALDAAGGTVRWDDLLLMTSPALGGALAALILSLALPAWIAAGDSSRSVFRRSLRLGLWLATLSIPVAAFSAFVTPKLRLTQGIDEDEAVGITVVVASIYALWIVLRSGLRYAGPAVGPGFDPVEPRCAECGYTLQGLPTTGRCPECGEPIARSLARYTKPLSDPPNVRRVLRRFAAVPRTIFRPTATFRALRVQFDAPEARRFWMLNLMGVGLVCSAYSLALTVLDAGRIEWEPLTVAIASIMTLIVGSQSLVAIVCVMGTLLRRGQRSADLRIATIALGYASAMLWPAALWVLMLIFAFEAFGGEAFVARRFVLPVLNRTATVGDFVWPATAVVFVFLLGLWTLWIDKGYRNLRHTSG